MALSLQLACRRDDDKPRNARRLDVSQLGRRSERGPAAAQLAVLARPLENCRTPLMQINTAAQRRRTLLRT